MTWPATQYRPPSGVPASGPGSGPASGVPAGGDGHGMPVYRRPRVYGPVAEALIAGLLADRPDLTRWPEAVASWAQSEAQLALLRQHLAEVGAIDAETGEIRGDALGWLKAYERLAREARKPLGLDPLAEAQLARERAAAAVLAVDLDGLAAAGRAALEARQVPTTPALDPGTAPDLSREPDPVALALAAEHQRVELEDAERAAKRERRRLRRERRAAREAARAARPSAAEGRAGR